jgi:cytochrome P450
MKRQVVKYSLSLSFSPLSTSVVFTYCLPFFRCLLSFLSSTAHTLSFILYCLAKHPLVMKKLQKDLDEITTALPWTASGTDLPLLSLNDISKCEYLNCCIKETQRLPLSSDRLAHFLLLTLRLYPAAPIISRNTLQDIHYNGFVIPKHSTVIVAISAMSRQPWIKNPLDYNPERWIENDTPSSTPSQANELKEMFLPFSCGKRSCIGQNLAQMELRVIVANLVRSFDFELLEEIEVDLFVTLKPIDLKMRFHSRKH